MPHSFFVLLNRIGSLALLGSLCLSERFRAPPLDPFSIKIANESVWLASAAYCDTNRVFSGPVAAFKFVGPIHDQATDTTGYYGVLERQRQIWIIYRGSHTTTNYWDDADTFRKDPSFPGCQSCLVHAGFLACHENTIKTVQAAVTQMRKDYPEFSIILSGHSLGGAIATLASVSLSLAGFSLSLYTMGSPRVGNENFARFYDDLFSRGQHQRLTHYRDLVPHLPYELMGYLHTGIEVYEDTLHDLHGCIGPHDPICAEQFSPYQTDVTDHLTYLEHYIPGACPEALRAVSKLQRALHVRLSIRSRDTFASNNSRGNGTYAP